MPETVGAIVLDVSTSLNDQQPGFTYARWPQVELVRFLDDALVQVGIYRPDAFSITQTMTLVPGAKQQLPAGLSLLKSVDYNAGASPCADAPIVECDLNILRTFFKKPCLPTGGAQNYRVRTYAYDARNPQVFYVSPPVPSWATPQVSFTAIQNAPIYTTADLATVVGIDQKYTNALKSWMLMKAYEVDTESSTSTAHMGYHQKHFYQMLGVNYKQESLFNSGYYLGQKGDKDQAAGRRG